GPRAHRLAHADVAQRHVAAGFLDQLALEQPLDLHAGRCVLRAGEAAQIVEVYQVGDDSSVTHRNDCIRINCTTSVTRSTRRSTPSRWGRSHAWPAAACAPR